MERVEKSANKKIDSILTALQMVVFGVILAVVLIDILASAKSEVFRFGAGVVESVKTPLEHVTMARSIGAGHFFMSLGCFVPLVFIAIVLGAIAKKSLKKFNLTVVLPVAIIVLFCFVMANIEIFAGDAAKSFAYLGFELIAMAVLMVYNLIDNMDRVDFKQVVKKTGAFGLCICILFYSLSSGGRAGTTVSESIPPKIEAPDK